MAEAALLGLAKSVLGQLSSPTLNEFLLLWNSKKDLKKLGKTIETITCFIHDAEQRPSEEHLVKLWLSRLREVLYDADDLFDAIAARALCMKAMDGSTSKKEVILFFSKSNKLGFVIKTAHDIKAIRECLDGIKDDMSPFQFQYQKIEEKRSRSVLEREERHSYVDNKGVIGRDQEKEDIISLLLCEDNRQQSLEVISVIGFGGLGKTTLAQFVYNDARVQKGFDLCLWTCINYLSNLKSVLVKMLNSKSHKLHLDELQRELREKIQGKKYLLVVDDLWDENASNWSSLNALLNCGKVGSKVLITTRKIRVAQCLDAIEPYYRLNVLSKKNAWSLFVEMTFKDGVFDGDSKLLSTGKNIIHRCGYVPLALSIIGRMLRYRKKDKEEWLSFLEKEFAGVVSDDSDDGNLIQVLKVSYNDLSHALKHCFAYCSVFPKDHKFDKDELVRMWVAQGFVEPHGRKSLEEVAEDYFFHMVDRCFFQEVKRFEPDIGVVRYTCKMHDLLHDLAIHVAGSEYCCFPSEDRREMVEMSALRHIAVTSLPNSLNRESFYCNLSSHFNSLRTLIFIGEYNIEINSLVLDRFTKLRTLVLSYLNIETLPDLFEGMIHLRYLDLSYNSNLTALPNSICKLYHLQTLLLTYCSKLGKLPSNLIKLASLRHLFLEGCSKLDSMPLEFAALTTLVSLDRFIVHPNRGGLRFLSHLDELCGMLTLELPVNGWTDCVHDAKKANMSSKCRLSGLSIKWINEVEEGKLIREERKAVLEELRPLADLQYLRIVNYISDKLPSWFSLLSNVKKLILNSCSLEYLNVKVKSGYLLPCLEVLELRDMHSLRGWWREATLPRDDAPMLIEQTLPRVSKLEIIGCKSLVENMPLFEVVEHLNLNSVSVMLLNMLVCNSNAHRSPQCHNYNKLQRLEMKKIEGLECLSEGSIKHLTALKSLVIEDCEKLSWVSKRGLMCLTSLREELFISGCGGVRLEDEDYYERPYANIYSYNYGLQRLRKLFVPWQCNLLLEGLQFLTSLEVLGITYYEEQQVETDNEDSEYCRVMWRQGLEKLREVDLSFGSMKCCFPEWALYLPCLLSLKLQHCGEMNVDNWVVQQTQSNSLIHLHIESSEDLSWVHDIPWELLPFLRNLHIDWMLSSNSDALQVLFSPESHSNANRMNILTFLGNLSVRGCSPEFMIICQGETRRGVRAGIWYRDAFNLPIQH